jgi:hypothetical protein
MRGACAVMDNGTWALGGIMAYADSDKLYIYRDAAGSNWTLSNQNTRVDCQVTFPVY